MLFFCPNNGVHFRVFARSYVRKKQNSFLNIFTEIHRTNPNASQEWSFRSAPITFRKRQKICMNRRCRPGGFDFPHSPTRRFSLMPEVEYTGWFSRLGKSFGSVIIGIILFIVA